MISVPKCFLCSDSALPSRAGAAARQLLRQKMAAAAPQIRVESRTSSAAIVRVRLAAEPGEGSAVALLVRPVACRALEAAYEAASRQRVAAQMAQHNRTHARMREQPAQGVVGHAFADRLREDNAAQAEIRTWQVRLMELEKKMNETASEALELVSNDARRMPYHWMLFRHNVLLDCAHHKLALAKISHARLGSGTLSVDEDCARKIAESLATLEPSLHSDLDTGSFVALNRERAEELESGAAESQFLTPFRRADAAVLLSGLGPHTQFEVKARVVTPAAAALAPGEPECADEGASTHWTVLPDSDPVEFWTEQAPWQLLLREHGLSDACAALLRRSNLRSLSDWAELVDDPGRADSIGLEPADRDHLAELCREHGAITQQEERKLKVEASELEALVATLTPAAVAQGVAIGDPVRVLDAAAAAAAAVAAVGTIAPPPCGSATTTTAGGGGSADGDVAQQELLLQQLVEAVEDCCGLGVIVALEPVASSASSTGGNTGEQLSSSASMTAAAAAAVAAVAVRFGEGGAGGVTLSGLGLSMLDTQREWMVFISHAQVSQSHSPCPLSCLVS